MAQWAPDDPLHPDTLKAPSVWESVRSAFMGDKRIFDVIQIEVTSACSARCVYCPHTTKRDVWKTRHMTAETYARLWPLLLQAKRIHLQGWGEPFLHQRFLDFVAVARRAECQVSTTTCGLHMTPEFAEKLVRSGLDIIAFSLAGSDAGSNAARQGISFEKVLASIRMLQQVRKKEQGVHLEIHLAYLLLASQLASLHALPALLHDLDAHAAVISTLDYVPDPALAAEAFMPYEREKIEQANAVLQEVARVAGQDGRNIYYSLPQETPCVTCLEGIERSLYVDADGNVSPCIYVNLPTEEHENFRRVYGNVHEADPVGIWNNAAFAAFRSSLRHAPDENCQNCPKRFAVGNRP